jgi:hypothetical protein
LAGLEDRYLDGSSVAGYFDLITGTSTGGVIALGLGAGLRAAQLRDLYSERGKEIFPPAGRLGRWGRQVASFFRYRYDRSALMSALSDHLGDRTLGQSQNRLCIPACDGQYGDLYVFKTPHHPDFRLDARERMTKVAAATAAAPTYYRPLEDGGYTFVDGGIWANNPIMVGLVDALSCFDVSRQRIRILSIGCGASPYTVDRGKKRFGGLLAWRDIISAAMHFQSLSALGMSGLLIGADRITRVDAPIQGRPIDLDDWPRAWAELPPAAARAVDEFGDSVATSFFARATIPYHPVGRFS